MNNTGYSLLDFGNGSRLEQWGPYRLDRPDPTTAGAAHQKPDMWSDADAIYKGEKGKGEWISTKTLPDHWPVSFGDLQMTVRLSPYKHTGVFPEQEQNWYWTRDVAKKSGRQLKVLNLFAYTGGASIALAKDGHIVTHVDSSKPAIGGAKENAELNQIAPDKIRWILDDAPTFAQKEVKRGKTYDAIILDPPAYGHGTSGKTWRVERDLAPLLEQCALLLSESPCFIVLNGYAQNDTPESFRRLISGILLTKTAFKKFTVQSEPLLLTTEDGRTLETGIVTRVRF